MSNFWGAVQIISDGLLYETTCCPHILLIEFRFHMGYGLHFQMSLLFKKRKINLSVWK